MKRALFLALFLLLIIGIVGIFAYMTSYIGAVNKGNKVLERNAYTLNYDNVDTNGIPSGNQMTSQPNVTQRNPTQRSSSSKAAAAAGISNSRTDPDLAKIVQQYEQVIGGFPPSALDKLQSYRSSIPTEVICKAFDEAAESGHRSWKYVNGILKSWQADFDALEKMDLSHVKLMWTNYPNMPTGGVAKRETYEKLVAFAQKHNIVVVNDNPYSLILNEHPMSIMQVPGAKDCCIEFNSLSKSHNMPGWRVAMISSNKTFISWILKVKSNIDNGSFRGIQLAAAEAMLNNTDEWHRENNIQNYRRRRDIAEEIMKVLDCQFDPNQVGMFLWGKIPEKYADVEDLTEKVLHEARVFITPGFIFGTNGKRYIRISLCAKDEKMKEALERIKKIF